MLRVTVTGSECTGKTTLASRLAFHFNCLWVPEYSREYAQKVNRELTYEDVEPIARGQVDRELRIAQLAGDLLILDTDLVSTVVYSNHYYGNCPQWVSDTCTDRKADLYLLLYPDVPWIADGIRDREHLRKEIHALFENALRGLDARFVEIRGSWNQRVDAAIQSVQELARG